MLDRDCFLYSWSGNSREWFSSNRERLQLKSCTFVTVLLEIQECKTSKSQAKWSTLFKDSTHDLLAISLDISILDSQTSSSSVTTTSSSHKRLTKLPQLQRLTLSRRRRSKNRITWGFATVLKSVLRDLCVNPVLKAANRVDHQLPTPSFLHRKSSGFLCVCVSCQGINIQTSEGSLHQPKNSVCLSSTLLIKVWWDNNRRSIHIPVKGKQESVFSITVDNFDLSVGFSLYVFFLLECVWICLSCATYYVTFLWISWQFFNTNSAKVLRQVLSLPSPRVSSLKLSSLVFQK